MPVAAERVQDQDLEAVRRADPTESGSTAGPAGPSAPFPLPALVVGPADDAAEVAADRRADAVVARLGERDGVPPPDPPDVGHHASRVRRTAGAAGGPVGASGGSLDPETEQRVEARRGRGDRLAGEVRRTFETAFGRTFATVNVHRDAEADRLSRRLSATAFTTGDDIFFSRGAYRPGDLGGDRLLAHELAHVEQGTGAARRTVRRAIGFEFETNVVVKELVDGSAEPAKKVAEPDGGMGLGPDPEPPKKGTEPDGPRLRNYPKQRRLREYDGFRMEADVNSVGSNIEFVVDPAIPEDGRDDLVTIMTEMVAEAGKIDVAARQDVPKKAAAEREAAQTSANAEYTGRKVAMKAAGRPERLAAARAAVPPETVVSDEAIAKKVDADRDAEIARTIGPPPVVETQPTVSFSDVRITKAAEAARIAPVLVSADPQVTGGVSMDKLFAVQKVTGAGGDQARNALGRKGNSDASVLSGRGAQGGSPATLATLVTSRLVDHPRFTGLAADPSERLKGVVTAAVNYLTNGTTRINPKPLPYPKLISGSMMMRTDLASMIATLPAGERRAIAENQQPFVDWVLALANLAGQGATRVFECGVLRDFTLGLPGGLDPAPVLQITRQDWLLGLAAGRDALSAATTGERGTLEGLGGYGNKFDKVGDHPPGPDTRWCLCCRKPRVRPPAVDGAIVEFRNMLPGRPPSAWANDALRAFDAIVAANHA